MKKKITKGQVIAKVANISPPKESMLRERFLRPNNNTTDVTIQKIRDL